MFGVRFESPASETPSLVMMQPVNCRVEGLVKLDAEKSKNEALAGNYYRHDWAG